MQDRSAFLQRLVALFAEHFHVVVPSPDTDLLDTGILDSLQVVDLLLHLEQDFGFRIAFEALELDDLRTLDRLAGLLFTHAGPLSVATASPAAPPEIPAIRPPRPFLPRPLGTAAILRGPSRSHESGAPATEPRAVRGPARPR